MTYPDALTLLKKQSLPNLVQEELARMILDGRLQPGEPLREAALAASLGVSRGPVREAFRRLEEKGLLRVEKNCGVFVRILTLQEADQIYEVRIALEVMIGRKTAKQVSEAGLAELRKILEAMTFAAEEDDVNPYTSLNLAFHDALARLSGNAVLHESYSRLVAQLSLFRRKAYLHNKKSMALSLTEHRAIFNAVEAGYTEQATELLRRHAEDSRQRLHQALGMVGSEPPPSISLSSGLASAASNDGSRR